MSDPNVVIIGGNLTRDPEVKFTPGGTAVARLGLANNRKWKDSQSGQMREEVCFAEVQAWGKSAENAGQYLKKGDRVTVEGSLKFEQWEDKQSGQKRSRTVVNASKIHFIAKAGGSQSGGQSGSQSGGQRPPPQRSLQSQAQPAAVAAPPANQPAPQSQPQGQAPANQAPDNWPPPDDDIPF